MSVSNSTRFQILQRDGFTCRYCGRSAPDVQLEVDHVEPRSQGGSDEPENLVAACFECNRGKFDKSVQLLEPITEEDLARAVREGKARTCAFFFSYVSGLPFSYVLEVLIDSLYMEPTMPESTLTRLVLKMAKELSGE